MVHLDRQGSGRSSSRSSSRALSSFFASFFLLSVDCVDRWIACCVLAARLPRRMVSPCLVAPSLVAARSHAQPLFHRPVRSLLPPPLLQGPAEPVRLLTSLDDLGPIGD